MRQPRIPQRRRIFLGCEGESERSYGAFLARILERRPGRFHIDTVLLRPGGGDPLALVQLAIKLMRQRIARAGPYVLRSILLDSDKLGLSPGRDANANALAHQNEVTLIWQDPCHEAFLLRHLENCADMRPPSADLAFATLLRRWPDYAKGMPAARIATRIDESGLRRAASVEIALRDFLAKLDFYDNGGN